MAAIDRLSDQLQLCYSKDGAEAAPIVNTQAKPIPKAIFRTQ
jgi:hypothetical protein